ncbi:MAG: hypothetical protein GWP05_09085 [Anaerolineaceae bacterium]|nr:hypothetical protein [Anaerolineaceae bacterium]
MRFVAAEAAGGLGDIGTFVPLVLGLVSIVGFDAATVLLFAGLATIYSGLRFGLPMPVQPMKAIAAIAIAGSLSVQQACAAGLAVGLSLLLLSAFGLTSTLKRLVPEGLVRALQAALGVKLAVTAIRIVLTAPATDLAALSTGGYELILFLAALAALLLFRRRTALVIWILLAFGLLVAWLSATGQAPAAMITLWRPRSVFTDLSALSGIWRGGLTQLPLTVLNAVLAASLLAGQLFPERKAGTTPTKLALSITLMNLISCPFGGMPVCHGSGGLAAHYRCGARTGWSLVILGAGLFLGGLLLGSLVVYWMRIFPLSILAAFLTLAGLTLVRASRCWSTRRVLISAVVMVAASQVFGTLLTGFVCAGILWALLSLVSRRRAEAGRSNEYQERTD